MRTNQRAYRTRGRTAPAVISSRGASGEADSPLTLSVSPSLLLFKGRGGGRTVSNREAVCTWPRSG